ncbi:MAG: PA14 domain-containing protein [Planctomycetota bacterium]
MARSTRTLVAAALAVVAPPLAAQVPCVDEVPLESGAVEAGDRFGSSIAVSGARVAVGAYSDDETGDSSGSVTVFELDPATGAVLGEAKIAPDATSSESYYGVAVDLDGDRLVAGALGTSVGGALQSGAVFVHERDANGNWVESALLAASDPTPYDWFGYSVALDGDRLVVGVPYDDDGGIGAGTARVFERDTAGDWIETARLVATAPQPNAHLGRSVDLDGDVCVVGAPNESLHGPESGAAHVFERQSDGTWVETAVLVPIGSLALDRFGSSVAVRGSTIAIGGPGAYGGVPDAGAVATFERDDENAWVEDALVLPVAASVGSGFGSTVALANDRLVVGARSAEFASVVVGTVTVYQPSPSGWSPIVELHGTDLDGGYGTAVDADGERIVVGHSPPSVASPSIGSASAVRVVAAPPGVVLVDPSVGAAGCNSIWDLAVPSLREALDLVIADPSVREVWIAEGEHDVEWSDIGAVLPDGVRFYGGFPAGGSAFEDRDPIAHETRLLQGSGFSPGIDASYWNNMTLTGTPVLQQVESTIDHDWGETSPSGVLKDKWSARWTAWLVPPETATYTFYTTTDDGVRLWIDGVLVINKWVDQSSTEWSGNISLQKGLPVSVRMEFFENTVDAQAELRWSSPSIVKQIVPAGVLGSIAGASRMFALDGTSLLVDGCTLDSGNSATTGGAVLLTNGARLTARNCRFTNCVASDAGGAVRVESGSRLEAVGCTFAACAAQRGGAISAIGAGTTVELVGCDVTLCTSNDVGAALHVDEGAHVRATNGLFSDDTATNDAAVAFVENGSTLELLHCTVTRNTAKTSNSASGALAAETGSTLFLRGTILWDNDGHGATAQVNQVRLDDGCLDVDRCIVQGWIADATGSSCGTASFGSVSAADPLLAGAADAHLALGSPAVDAGSAADLPLDVLDVDGDGDVDEELPLDHDGRLRRWDDALADDDGSEESPRPDLGCYERGVPPFVESIDCATTPLGSLAVVAGAPSSGGSIELELVDPTSTMGPNSLPLLGLSARLVAPTDPCSNVLPGLGMTGPADPGALVVDLGSGSGGFLLYGPLLATGGEPTSFVLAIPSAPSFVGLDVFVQGAIVDLAAANAGVSNALRLVIGPEDAAR